MLNLDRGNVDFSSASLHLVPMDDETSRASYDNSTSRFSEDFHSEFISILVNFNLFLGSEKFRLETQLHDAQSELYHLRRLMPFLESTNPDDPGVTVRFFIFV